MFTGLIQEVGTIRTVEPSRGMWRLLIEASIASEGLSLGESIAVDGVCLTVSALGKDSFTVEVSPETLSRTTLGMASPGTRVNLERALRPIDRLGGHLVTGHIDGTATIHTKAQRPGCVELKFLTSETIGRYLVEKGSVAVDGISLTVNSCSRRSFDVLLIPHTIAHTTLAFKRPGQKVNIECDIIAKYVERLLKIHTGKISIQDTSMTEDLLRQYGFLK